MLTLRQKLLTLVMIVLVPLTAVILLDLARHFVQLRSDALGETADSAESTASNISRLVHQMAEQAQTAGLAIVSGRLDAEESLLFLDSLGQHVPAEDYAVVTPDGVVLAETEGGLARFTTTPWFESAVRGEELGVAVEHDVARQTARLVVFARVEMDGRIAAVSMVSIATDTLEAAVRARANETQILTGPDGRAIVVVGDSQGVDIGDDLAGVVTVAEALQGRRAVESAVRLPNSRTSLTGVHVPIPDAGLTAGAYVPSTEVLRQVVRDGSLSAVVVLAVVFIAAAASRAYGQSLVQAVHRLSDAAHSVAEGDFRTLIPVDSGDELGALAQDFRTMQSDLERTFEDARLLEEAARRLNEALGIEDVARVGLDYAARLLHARNAILTVFGDTANRNQVVLGYNATQPDVLLAQARDKVPDADLIGRRFRSVLLAAARPGSRETEILVSFPLERSGELLGRIDVTATTREPDAPIFERSDVELAITLMQQIGAALENSGLYEREREIAESLQDALLTPPPPLSRLRMGLVYRAATVGARIGGDFYDIIDMGGDRVAVAIGDISGKGLAAARHTLAGKGAIRSFALDDPRPASVLERANSVIAEEIPTNAFITALYALMDLTSGRVGFAVAGHPAPVLIRNSRASFVSQVGGPPLGVVAGQAYAENTLVLQAEDRLVLFTDGITEARDDEGRFFADVGLLDVLQSHADADPQQLAERVSAAAEAFAGGRLQDDLAVVVLERVPEAAESADA